MEKLKCSYTWIVCFVAFLVQFCNHSPNKTMPILLDDIVTEFGVDYAATTLVFSVFMLSNALAGMVCSSSVDILGCRALCAVGGTLAAAGFAVSGNVQNINVLYVTFGFAGGTGISLMTLSCMVQGARYFEKRRSLVSGIINSGSSAATIIWSPIVSYVLVSRGLEKVMYFYALTCIICVFLAFFLKPPCEERGSEEEGRYILMKDHDSVVTRESSCIDTSLTNSISSQQQPNHKNENEAQNEENQSQINAPKTIISSLSGFVFTQLKPLSSPLFLMYLLYKCLLYFVIHLPIAFLPSLIMSYFDEHSHLPEFDNYNVGYVLSIVGVCNYVSRLLAGYVCDFPNVDALIVSAVAIWMSAVCSLIMAQHASYVTYVICGAAYGLFTGPPQVLSVKILCDLFGTESLASNLGIDMFFQGISAMLGALLGGVLYDLTKSYTWIYNLISIYLACGGIVCCLIYVYHKTTRNQR